MVIPKQGSDRVLPDQQICSLQTELSILDGLGWIWKQGENGQKGNT